MTALQQKIEAILRDRIPEEGLDALDIYGDLYHGELKPLLPIIVDAMTAARDAGKMRPCPNNGAHDFWSLEHWDRFVAQGTDGMHDYEVRHLISPVVDHLSKAYLDWAYDPDGVARQKYPDASITTAALVAKVSPVETVTWDHVPAIAAMLAGELEEPRSRPVKRIEIDRRTAVDDRYLELRFEGWEPVLYEALPDYSGIRRTELPVLPSPARHYEVTTTGKLLVMGIKDFGGIFAKAMRKAVRKAEKDQPYRSIASNEGANESTLRAFAATGFLEIHLGDYFPRLIRDGDVIRGAWACDGDELPDGLETVFRRGLHMPVMVCLDQARALVEHLGMDVEKAMAEIDKDAAACIVDVAPGPLHIYGPDGWRVEDFGGQFQPRGLDRIPEGPDCFFLSSEPLLAEAECVDVAMLEAPRFGDRPATQCDALNEDADEDPDCLSL